MNFFLLMQSILATVNLARLKSRNLSLAEIGLPRSFPSLRLFQTFCWALIVDLDPRPGLLANPYQMHL
jgi:hypothetical protein